MYVYVCMLVCVQVCVVACVCVCRGACKTMQACVRGPEVRLWYCSSGIVHFRFLRQGLSLTWNALKQMRLARDAQETVFISLPSAGIRSACCHSWLVECGFWGSNSYFYAYKASVSPTGQTAAQIGGLKRKKFLWKRLPSDWKVGGGDWGERNEREGLELGLKIVSTKLWNSSSQPVGWDPHPPGVTYQIFILRFIRVVKLQLWSSNEIISWLGVTTTWGTVLKRCGIRKVENHCLER